ncbi:FxLYD domain-containing protein [Halobacillus yeomjeoni]|uniref:Lipoprotein n=1 Tax=Halobacillus yeomjeoni TaxID=311194 RepID=A0A931HU87_9BACI|nr:FxLYD domain-containing protein [Halobacillus yeomjeoni]MBH0229533.1 hypothetical protein [Halobacillus yeomjeoni]
MRLLIFAMVVFIISFFTACSANPDNIKKDFNNKLTDSAIVDEKLYKYRIIPSLFLIEEDSNDYHYVFKLSASPNEDFNTLSNKEKAELAIYVGEFVMKILDSSNLSETLGCKEYQIECSISSVWLQNMDSYLEYSFEKLIQGKDFDVTVGKSVVNNEKISIPNKNGNSVREVSNNITSEGGLELEETSCSSENGLIKAKGYIKNTGSKSYSYVRVKVSYLDSNDKTIDTDWTYGIDSQPLNPNDRRSYEILSNSSDAISNCKQVIVDFD